MEVAANDREAIVMSLPYQSAYSIPSLFICVATTFTSCSIVFLELDGLRLSVMHVQTSSPSVEEVAYKFVSMRTFFSFFK